MFLIEWTESIHLNGFRNDCEQQQQQMKYIDPVNVIKKTFFICLVFITALYASLLRLQFYVCLHSFNLENLKRKIIIYFEFHVFIFAIKYLYCEWDFLGFFLFFFFQIQNDPKITEFNGFINFSFFRVFSSTKQKLNYLKNREKLAKKKLK